MQRILLHDGYGSCSNSGELSSAWLLWLVRLMSAYPSGLIRSVALTQTSTGNWGQGRQQVTVTVTHPLGGSIIHASAPAFSFISGFLQRDVFVVLQLSLSRFAETTRSSG
jgi:hypothetical protein